MTSMNAGLRAMGLKVYEPHRPKGRYRCDALDQNGRRCRRIAVIEECYHGDAELYSFSGPPPTWVLVRFCSAHTEHEHKVQG